MADEQAFLDALAANLADDTTRLVYADWLDDRGESAKAAYLRRVVEMVPRSATGEVDPVSGRTIQAAAESLPREWRATAAGRFSVVIYGYAALDKIGIIKLVRELTGFGLAEAKEFVEALPARLPMRTTPEDAVSLREHLRTVPSVRAEVRPCDTQEPAHDALFRISAYLEPTDLEAYWNTGLLPDGAADAFRDFLVAVGTPPDGADDFFETGLTVTVADSVEASDVPRRLRELESRLPASVEDPAWGIHLHAGFINVPRSPPR